MIEINITAPFLPTGLNQDPSLGIKFVANTSDNMRGTAEIHVILSISHTFISKRTYNHGFPYYFSTYYHTS